MYHTYVLYSIQFNKIYIGFSSNLELRLSIHNSDKNTGWTSKYKPWEVLYSENFETKKEAMLREKQLKTSRGRAYIWDLVSSRNN
ncbi:MAG: GIY-YIG nuclease family protein [Bacteroidales bacterium]|nr:GIY-YIG nuclease family protein [Bacteroidales bacterium]